MRLLGLVLLIGGLGIRIFSRSLSPLDWILMGLGAVIVIISYLTKRK